MFISALLTKFRTNPADFTAHHPARRRFAVIETQKEKILSAFHFCKKAFRFRIVRQRENTGVFDFVFLLCHGSALPFAGRES